MFTSNSARSLAALAAAGGIGALTSQASAQLVRNWLNPVSGDWGVNGNWDASPFPNNGGGDTFIANIAVGTTETYTVSLDQPITVTDCNVTYADASLNLSSFALGRSLTIERDMTRLSGQIHGEALGDRGRLTVNGDLVLNNATRTINTVQHVSLVSNGRIVINSTGTEDICDSDIDHGGSAVIWAALSDITWGRGSTFRHRAGSDFDVQGDANWAWNGRGAIPTFTNEGVWRKSAGAGEFFFSTATLENTGTIQVELGTFRADNFSQVGATLTDGRYRVFTSAALEFDGRAYTTNRAEVEMRGTGILPAIDPISLNDATGIFTLRDSKTFSTLGTYTNAGLTNVHTASIMNVPGDLNVTGGRVVIGSASLVDVLGSVTQLGGVVDLQGGTLRAAGLYTMGAPAALVGSGIVDGGIVSAGTISPGASAGLIHVVGADTGGFVQFQPGSLFVAEIGGFVPGLEHDQLRADGFVFIAPASTLEVQLIAPFIPNVGDFFDIIVARNVQGQFDNLTGVTSFFGRSWLVQYPGDRVRLFVIPAPSALGLLTLGGLLALRRRR